MPSATRVLLLVVQATIFAGLLFAGNPVLSSPLPIAATLTPRRPAGAFPLDLASDLPTGNAGSILPGVPTRRDGDSILSNINILNNYYTELSQHASNFREMAHRAPRRGSDDQEYRQQTSSELTAFHTNLLGFEDTLRQLGADKGLANYDQNNDLETLLKHVVNATKDILSDTDELVYELPLGSVLGPIVYEIKCILDEVLDATENLTDAIINALEPLLQQLIIQASNTACHSGIQLGGLCILA